MVEIAQPNTRSLSGAAPDPDGLVLASASPRRRELLAALGASYLALANDAEERDDPVPSAVLLALPSLALERAKHPTLLAWRKASHAAAIRPEAVILGADTIVVLDGEVLNKPRDAAHAKAMLRRLSGRRHIVYTGLCVIAPAGDGATWQPAADEVPPACRHAGGYVWLDLVASEVELADVSAATIAAYVATGEPLDKAGAYGIQGLGGDLVRNVWGSYTAVVGLPLPATHRLLRTTGVVGLIEPAAAYLQWLQSQGKEPLPCPPTLP